MRYVWLLTLPLLVLTAVSAAGIKHDFSVRLKVIDSSGKPLPEFEVRVHSHDQGSVPWKRGKEGEILLQSKDNDFPMFGSGLRYQLVIRAADFAPTIIEMDRPEGHTERTVTLSKGHSIDLLLTTTDGRAIPESLVPIVIFPDFQSSAWGSFQQPDRYYNIYRSGLNFTSLVTSGPGHYTFHIAEYSPQIYVFVDHPGFIRAFRAGPFGREELADGKLEIKLPKPAEIEIVLELPKEPTEKLPYDIWSVRITRQSPDDETKGHPVASVRSSKPDMQIIKEFFAPGDYWITFETGLSDNSTKFEYGRLNAAYYRDMRRCSFTAGQVENIVFRYTAYDEDKYKGDYGATVNVRLHNGEPAAVPYVLYYNDKHFGSINIKEGTIADDGRIELTALAGGEDAPHFTLEIDKGTRGRHFIQLDGAEKHRMLEYRIAPQKGEMAPDIVLLEVFSGEKVRLSNYKGKVILLEFWATWCGPCQGPLAKMCEVVSRRKQHWKGKAEVLAVSIDTKKQSLVEHVRGRGWLAVRHMWCDEGEPGWKSEAAQVYGITGVPTALLIDQSGHIVWRGHPRSFDIEAKIDELLKIK